MPISVPEADKWKLADTDENSQHCGRVFIFDFSYMAETEMKAVFKAYIWRNYRIRNRTVKKLYEDHICFRHFNAFAAGKGITTFRNITYGIVVEFISYLRLKTSDKTKTPLSHKYQKSCLDALKSVIHWCQIHLPDCVPEKEVFAGNEYRGINKRLRIDFIPDDVLAQVNNALENEENLFLRYGIVILESTGIRLGDLLALKVGCISPHPISGHTIEWYDHKGRKARSPMPVTQDCANAVIALEKYTRELRKQADSRVKDLLFIHRPGQSGNAEVTTITQMSFGNWLKAFVRKNDIRGTNGDFYKLTAHKFRRTLATDMLSKGADIKVVQEVLGHASVLTAKKYYADVKDKEMAETLGRIGIIGNLNILDKAMIPDEAERQWFLSNKDGAARMCDGYCTRPINSGNVCERLLRRRKCYTCSRFITTVEDLEAHRSHLKELEELLESNIYGEHYAAHFTPVVAVLREIIRRLEEIDDGDE